MQISMWNLADYLFQFDKYTVKCFISEGLDTIRSVRWMAGDSFEPEVVYICRNIESSGCNALAENSTYIVHRYDIIHITGEDTDLIFNKIISFIDALNQWEKNLAEIALECDGLQKMIDISVPLLKVPIFIYDTSARVLAISRNFGPELHYTWEELLRENKIPDERFLQFKLGGNFDQVLLERIPTFHRSAFYEYNYWHCGIYSLDNRLAQLVCFDFGEYLEFPLGIKTLISTLVYYCQKHIARYYYLYQPLSMLSGYIIDILDGKPVDLSLVDSIFSEMDWSFNDKFCIYLIGERSSGEYVLIHRIYTILAKNLSMACTVLYDHKVVIIFNISRQGENVLASYQKEIYSLLNDSVYCGTSYNFYDFWELCDYYAQACFVLDYAIQKDLHMMYVKEYRKELINEGISSVPWLHCFSDERVDLLKKIDESAASEYYNTLRQFIHAGCRLAETARKLMIHRNTLLYRLNRISELIGEDILSLTKDDQIVDDLWLSFFLNDSKNAPSDR